MKIQVGELQQIAKFRNEAFIEKGKSQSNIGGGAGIIMGGLMLIGLFSMGKHASIVHTIIPSIVVFFGAYKIFSGASSSKKSKAAMEKMNYYGEEKVEYLENAIEEMTSVDGKNADDAFCFQEVYGSGGNATIIDWKGKFNGDMVILLKEPRDEIYFLLIDEMEIETGKKAKLTDRESRGDEHLIDKISLRGKLITESDDYLKSLKATFKFSGKKLKGEISHTALEKFKKWKQGSYPVVGGDGEDEETEME